MGRKTTFAAGYVNTHTQTYTRTFARTGETAEQSRRIRRNFLSVSFHHHNHKIVVFVVLVVVVVVIIAVVVVMVVISSVLTSESLREKNRRAHFFWPSLWKEVIEWVASQPPTLQPTPSTFYFFLVGWDTTLRRTERRDLRFY